MARSVLEAAQKEPVLNVQACIFGGDDFAASICATRTPASQELMHARQSVVVHCRAFGVQPIDIVQVGATCSLCLNFHMVFKLLFMLAPQG